MVWHFMEMQHLMEILQYIDSSIINSIEGIDENLKKEIISLLKECKKKDSPKLKEFIINQILPLPVKVAGEVLTAMILSKIGM